MDATSSSGDGSAASPFVKDAAAAATGIEQAAAAQQAGDSSAAKAFNGKSSKGKKGQSVNTFVHPPERHISVDPNELKTAIKNRLELSDRAQFDDLTKLMEGVANFDFYDLKQRMRKNFLPFSCGARNTIYLQRSSKALPTTDTLDKKEDEFIADVYEVLAASHYTLLTKEEWDLATSENFNLNLPMEVNWDYMDKGLLEKFWESSPSRKALRQTLPDCMADRILVFHRGIGTERVTGMLIDQKLDLLMDYTVFYLLDKIKAPFSKKTSKPAAAKPAAAVAGAAPGAVPIAAAGTSARSTSSAGDHEVFHVMDRAPKGVKTVVNYLGQRTAVFGGAEHANGKPVRGMSASGQVPVITEVGEIPDGAAISQYEFEEGVMIASRHRYAKRVERQTLARQCPTLLTLLKSFPLSMSLQEPTFKDLVVVYRREMPERKPPTAAANAPNKNKEERLQGILQHRNINIKVFGETPMADVEIIFPDKVVGIKPFQLVNLAVTVIGALVAGAMIMWKAQNINMNILWTAASLVLTRCFAVYTQAQTQRTMLQQQMTSSLYDKMQDSQEGVISVITEELSDQQLKQMLLAYMVLIMKGRAMKQEDLDNACEDFLMKEFDHPIDYALESALPRLQAWGLVTVNSQGKLEAKPMSEAIDVLERAWAIAYKEIGKEGAEVATIDMITGNASVFKAGIEKNAQRRAAQAEYAAQAEAARKAGVMGKAKGVFSTATGGLLGSSSKSSGGGLPPNGIDAYSSGGAYHGGPHSPPSDMAAGPGSIDEGSTQGSSGGAPERKKSGSLKGMFKKLKH